MSHDHDHDHDHAAADSSPSVRLRVGVLCSDAMRGACLASMIHCDYEAITVSTSGELPDDVRVMIFATDGRDVVADIAALRAHAPVMALLVLASDGDQVVRALDAGAESVHSGAITATTLRARLIALLRRTRARWRADARIEALHRDLRAHALGVGARSEAVSAEPPAHVGLEGRCASLTGQSRAARCVGW